MEVIVFLRMAIVIEMLIERECTCSIQKVWFAKIFENCPLKYQLVC